MNEIIIKCNPESPQDKGGAVLISAENTEGQKLLYKFLIGVEGKWQTLKDFSEESVVRWIPAECGSYTIMVQGKREKSFKPLVSKIPYVIGKTSEELIRDIAVNNSRLKVGDKQTVTVYASEVPLMFRFWMKVNNKWELLSEYNSESSISFTVKNSGNCEILVEAKEVNSNNSCDDFKSINFYVDGMKSLEIIGFRCLNQELLADEELIFEVDAASDDSRMSMYKFVKFTGNSSQGQCIQEFSTKRGIAFTEKVPGEYRLLCLARDMYSHNEYDDRAVINYRVKKYREVKIKNFSCDMNSPQACGADITLQGEAEGGRQLLYRFVVDGIDTEDTGFSRGNSHIWKAKRPGKYKLWMYVKDASYEDSYEDMQQLDFEIEEFYDKPIIIRDIILDNRSKVLVNETVNIMAIAEGGADLRYCFRVLSYGEEVSKVDYGTCNWVNFTPAYQGGFSIEIRVKHKYSKREFDAHGFVDIEAYDYIPAEIDYILVPFKDYYIVGDQVNVSIIATNTSNILMKYVLYINGHKAEATDYLNADFYTFKPRCSGFYNLEVYARNRVSTKEYDTKREIRIEINEAIPITNTKITVSDFMFRVNEAIVFTVDSSGGKEPLYEFYIMEHGEWTLVQNYSRKNFYSFIPFSPGKYKLLALCKSAYKNCAYEDYDMFEFVVLEI